MSEDSYLLEPKEKKTRTPYEWFMLLLRILFFVTALTLVVITVLANMGGNGEVWHDGVRHFISEISAGRPVKLGKLNHMGFFPTVLVDIEDVGIYAKEEDEVPLISVDQFRLGMPFWNVATRSPRITDFYVEEFSAIKGVFMPNEFSLEKMFIDHDQESTQATLRVNGKIGLQSWSVEAGLEVQKTITGTNTYILAPKTPFAIDFADIHIKGVYDHVSSKHMKVENFELRTGEKVVKGDIFISSLGDKLIKLKGTLDIQNGRTIISPDLVMDMSHKDGAPTQVTGEIKSEKLVIDDILGKESIFSILTRLRELMGYEGVIHRMDGTPAFLGTHDINLHIFLSNVEAGDAFYEALSFDVLQEAGRLRVSTVIGKDDRKLMPAMMLLQKEPKSEYIISIIQDGTLDIDLLRPWLNNLPSELSGKQSIQVRCGIGEFFDNEGSLDEDTIEAFALDTEDGIFTIKESTVTKDQSLFDLHFERSTKVTLRNIDLPKEHYDFVKASLRKSGKGAPCESYISLKKPQQE
ncbi:MAG: hypothetical protein KAJ29_00640 [Alphaproteobacteria bacterium]|nr:hypothetical protein [Alphaproteobacteria bacterium]